VFQPAGLGAARLRFGVPAGLRSWCFHCRTSVHRLGFC
jgi:hypothetical protein